MDGQMKKGILEMCVLSLISYKECYGYEIAQKVKMHFKDISDSTIYGILRRLQRGEEVEIFYKKRNMATYKYYKISDKGRQNLALALDSWLQLSEAVTVICFNNDGED